MTTLGRPNIPPEYYGASGKNVSLAKNVPEAKMLELGEWCKNPRGNVVFWGKSGRGKTYTAIALMYWCERFYPWDVMRFVNVGELNQQWLANMSDYAKNFELLEKLKHYRLLVLDDIGLRKPSEAFLDFLHVLIDWRCGDPERVTIFTTNLSAQEFNDLLGPRIVSRIGNGIKIEFIGNDNRKPN